MKDERVAPCVLCGRTTEYQGPSASICSECSPITDEEASAIAVRAIHESLSDKRRTGSGREIESGGRVNPKPRTGPVEPVGGTLPTPKPVPGEQVPQSAESAPARNQGLDLAGASTVASILLLAGVGISAAGSDAGTPLIITGVLVGIVCAVVRLASTRENR